MMLNLFGFFRKLMKRSSKPDEEEAARDDGLVQAEPIIVDHPPKPDPKLLNTVLKVIFSSANTSLPNHNNIDL